MPSNLPTSKQYEATFSRTTAVVLIVMMVPVIFCLGMVLPIALWPDMPDWGPMLLALPTVAVALAAVRFCYMHYVAIPATVELNEAGIRICLHRHSPFYRNEYGAAWSAVSRVSSTVETNQNARFYRITFRDGGTTVQLMPDEYADEYCETALGETISEYISRHNEACVTQPQSLIRQVGFSTLPLDSL